MRINFPYYVETRKLPQTKALSPLFEAISNSIDAIGEHEEIESTFLKGDGLGYIHFDFVCEEGAIQVIEEVEKKDSDDFHTVIKLINCKREFIDVIPKRRLTIAEEIITHFLPYFMVTGVPEIILREEGFDDINLNTLFEEYISTQGEQALLNIGNENFDVIHTKTRYHSQRNPDHRVFYVANGRVVESEVVSADKVSNIPPRLEINNEDHVYIGYVESEYLNQNVNQARDNFDIPKSINEHDMFQEVDWDSIQQNVHSSIEKYLGEYLEVAREEKDQKIKGFINNKAPNYSYIYKYHKEQVDKIPYQSVQKGRIEQELHRIHTTLRSRFIEEANKVLSLPDDELTAEEYKQKITSLVEQLNPAGKADLAEYIIHRRIILGLLDKALKRKSDGKFEKEDVIHSYIFPIRSTTDDITHEEHNLWLLDERLAYNSYIASDKPFGQIPGYGDLDLDNKRKRPDLFAYAYATVEPDESRSPFKALDVFEFKRPMRDDYTDKENPYHQIKDYLDIIRKNSALTKDERSFSVVDGGLIYCHIICDFTAKLRNILEKDG